MHFAPAELRRFRWNEYRLERFLRIWLEQVDQLLVHFFRVDITDYDERQIVWDVARFVILHHLLLCKLVVYLDFTDHWKAIGMHLIRCRKKKEPSHAIGIIHSHDKLAPNHFLFFLVFLRRQSR